MKHVFICLAIMCGLEAASARPIERLAHRILGADDTNFVFVCQPDTLDYFQLETKDGKICITGNNDNSMAMGLNYYLQHYAHVYVSWHVHEPVELPTRYPLVTEPVRREALVKERFFLNYCTFGYTMPWWKWEQWERFIDWMALHGITMPLAITGQEAVWYEVWRDYGLTDEEIRGYFSGPAHLPWHRMANLDGFGGPLPMSWIEGQKELQMRILERERELDMTPVLPAFAGHVPARFADMHPEADIKPLSAWCGFAPTHFLNSSDPLFAEIQKRFMEKEIALFGTDHIYGVDPFNEMDPPHWQPEYLSDVSENIYYSLRKADPDARWLQMTGVFYYKRKSWTTERLRAYLSAVPRKRLILLDYFCEKTEVWRTTESFFGQPFIWCYLGNFGGNTMLVGNVHDLEERLSAALREAGPNMTGVGSTLEAFDVSPQIYEYLFSRAWESNPDVDAWMADWAQLRCGLSFFNREWKLLNDSVYKDNSFYGLGTQLVARPSLEGHGTYYTKPAYSYSNDTLGRICRQLLNPVADARMKDAFQYDIVNLMSQWVGNYFMTVRDNFTAAYKKGDLKGMVQQKKLADRLFRDVDGLLSSHPSFMLGPWIENARAWGTTPAEKDYFEQQARTILTIWGGPVLNDYANRMWGGLVKDYYAKRWDMFFRKVLQCARQGKSFDEKAFNEELSAFEQDWTRRHTHYAVSPRKNTLGEALKIYDRYMREFYGEVR
jgi:alpha-N-acetylglucosaminidase